MNFEMSFMSVKKKKKILIVTKNLPPVLGGMERLNQQIIKELSEYYEVHVICPAGSERITRDVAYYEVPLKPLWMFLLTSIICSIWIAVRIRPSFVLGGSGLVGPAVKVAALSCQAKSIVYLHGLDVVIDNYVYQSMWLPFIRSCDVAIVNSGSTALLAEKSGVNKDKINIIHPGVAVVEKELAAEALFRRKYGLDGSRVLLSVGRLTERKGMYEFVRDCLPKIVREVPEAILVIVGAGAANALSAKAEAPERIVELADSLGLKRHVIFTGALDDVMLQAAYAIADVHVFPVRELPGDVEGFGMVTIEAAMHGTPTVAYAVGGVVEAISDRVSGHLVSAEDSNSFSQMTVEILRHGMSEANVRDFAMTFEWGGFTKKMLAVLEGGND